MENNFIKHPKQERLVNLSNVSFIFMEEVMNGSEPKYRIIFNLCYSINLDDNLISDYIYWSFDNKKECEEVFNQIKLAEGFTKIPEDHFKLVNLSKVSSIKIDRKKLRLIWNLNNSVERTIRDSWNKNVDKKIITSDFVYWDFSSEEKFNEYIDKI